MSFIFLDKKFAYSSVKSCCQPNSFFFLFFQQVWPIFARGGDYGPRYDMLEDGEIDESNDDEENDFEKRSAAEIFVDALTKKGWYFMLNKVSIFKRG